MSILPKRWLLADQLPHELLRRDYGLNPVIAQILYNRGFTDPQAARRFLGADRVDDDPFRMKGMDEAVARIRQAIKKNEPVIVYGDFDADGVTSTALLVQTLTALAANVRPYIPHRVDEGYGLNSHALRKLAQAGARLIITVDCGIRSVDEVEDARAFRLDIIVTDHHSIGPEIPRALAVINPKQHDCRYAEDMLAGVGVTFKLADALLRAARNNARNHSSHKPDLALEDLLDLVAIGTVADLAPLNRTENRALVRRGLEVINRAQRPGVRALLEVSGIKPGAATAMSIGYSLGPRINAAGRLENAMIAYDLLCSSEEGQAAQFADRLQKLNVERQDLTRAAQDMVRSRLDVEHQSDLPLIFASDRNFRPGIVGLVAGRLAEEFFRPVVVMEEGDTESRASCRSIPQFDITHALDQCTDLLVRHGGHAQAAGFTVLNQNVPQLRSRLLELASDRLSGQDLRPTLHIDVESDIHHLSDELVTELAQLEPTGHENPSPVLMIRSARVLDVRTVGKDSQHLKLKLARAGQPPLDAIGFSLGEWAARKPEYLDLAFQLEMNEWNGTRSLQLHLLDVRPAGYEA